MSHDHFEKQEGRIFTQSFFVLLVLSAIGMGLILYRYVRGLGAVKVEMLWRALHTPFLVRGGQLTVLEQLVASQEAVEEGVAWLIWTASSANLLWRSSAGLLVGKYCQG